MRFKQPVAVVPQISQRPTADRAFLVYYFAALADDPQADEAGRSAGGRFEAEPAVAMMGGSSAGGAVTVKRRGVEVVRERHGASPHRLCLFVPHGGAEEGAAAAFGAAEAWEGKGAKASDPARAAAPSCSSFGACSLAEDIPPLSAPTPLPTPLPSSSSSS